MIYITTRMKWNEMKTKIKVIQTPYISIIAYKLSVKAYNG